MDLDTLWNICMKDMMWITHGDHIILEMTEPILLKNEQPEFIFQSDFKTRTNLSTKCFHRCERYICGRQSVIWMFTFQVAERKEVFRHVFLAIVLKHQTQGTESNAQHWVNMPLPKVILNEQGRIQINLCETCKGNSSAQHNNEKDTHNEKWLTAMVVDQGQNSQCACGSWRIRFKKCPQCTAQFCSSTCAAYSSHWAETHKNHIQGN